MKRRLTMLLALVAALVGLTAWSFWQMQSCQASMEDAFENLQVCHGLIERLEILRARPQQAALSAEPTTNLTKRIEQAAATAKLATNAIIRIDPQTASRLDDSSYQTQPTRVELRDITLPQLAKFLNALVSLDAGLEVSALQLTAPRHETDGNSESEQWSAEVVLTYLVFSPKVRRS
jgi:hypothetical protein